MKLSTSNKLLGTVEKITRGAVSSVVRIKLDSPPPTITAVILNDAVTYLNLTEGEPACAVIKASNVIVGICQEGCGCGGQPKKS